MHNGKFRIDLASLQASLPSRADSRRTHSPLKLLRPAHVKVATQLTEFAKVETVALQGSNIKVFVRWVADSLHDLSMPHLDSQAPTAARDAPLFSAFRGHNSK